MEDVKLCCRRTPSLLEFIAGQADKLKAEKEAGKQVGGACGEASTLAGATVETKKSRGGRKRTTAVVIDDD